MQQDVKAVLFSGCSRQPAQGKLHKTIGHYKAGLPGYSVIGNTITPKWSEEDWLMCPYAGLNDPDNKVCALAFMSFVPFDDKEGIMQLDTPFDSQDEGTIFKAYVMENDDVHGKGDDSWLVFRFWPVLWVSNDARKAGQPVRSAKDYAMWQRDVQVARTRDNN